MKSIYQVFKHMAAIMLLMDSVTYVDSVRKISFKAKLFSTQKTPPHSWKRKKTVLLLNKH